MPTLMSPPASSKLTDHITMPYDNAACASVDPAVNISRPNENCGRNQRKSAVFHHLRMFVKFHCRFFNRKLIFH